MEKKVLTRQELYEVVWKEPRSHIAKRLGVKVVTLKQTCKRMYIPLPETGYWSKLKFGKQVVVEKLPDNYGGNNEVSIDSMIQKTKRPRSQQQQIIHETEQQLGSSASVPKRLSNPHPLIITTKKKLADRNASESYINRWDMYRSVDGALNISVGSKHALRSLMDTIIKILNGRGHNVIIKEKKTYAVMWDQKCEIRLREKLKLSESYDRWGSRMYERTGILSFEYGIKTYKVNAVKDSAFIPIEEKISTIIAKLETWAKDEIKSEIDAARWRKNFEEQQRIEKELQERKEKELADFFDLFGQALRLNQANFIRQYVKTVETEALKNGGIPNDLKQWLEWANQKIDWYDPLINKQDPLLGETNKKHIVKKLLIK